MAASAHSGAQQARQLIADRLREIREQAGLTGRDVAAACGWHPAKTSRIENAKTAPSAEDLRAWCRACGADDQADDLVASLHAVAGMFIEWRRMERTGLRHAQEAVRPRFERTRRFRAYSSWLIPGMIQTPAYIEKTLRATQQHRRLPDDVDEAVAVRIERQRLLTEGERVFALLIEESVLHSDTGDATVMTDQLRHLIDVARSPNVSIGIIPIGLYRTHRPVEGFWIYDNTQVNVELVSGYLTITQPREIAMYDRTFLALADHAVYGSEARTRIQAAIGSLGTDSAPRR
ncbi:MAG: helix-turn-helix domain-containing protein [Micromonosporaceae bacterium]